MEGDDCPASCKEATVLDAMVSNFKGLGEKVALHWLDQNCSVVESYTYSQLEVRTKEIARDLLAAAEGKTSTSKMVVLCYPPGLEFILTFLGCLRGGFIPGQCLGS